MYYTWLPRVLNGRRWSFVISRWSHVISLSTKAQRQKTNDSFDPAVNAAIQHLPLPLFSVRIAGSFLLGLVTLHRGPDY